MIIGKTRTNQPVESNETLDAKLVNLPLPATTGQGGKVLAVKSDGTGYELVAPQGATGLYYHGIAFSSSVCEVQCVIFNNSSTAFTKDTFYDFITDLMDNGAIINCNGCIKQSSDIFPVYLIVKAGGDYIIAFHTTTSVQQTENFASLWEGINYFHDGVNQIL